MTRAVVSENIKQLLMNNFDYRLRWMQALTFSKNVDVGSISWHFSNTNVKGCRYDRFGVLPLFCFNGSILNSCVASIQMQCILLYCILSYLSILYRISIWGKWMIRQYRAQFFCRTQQWTEIIDPPPSILFPNSLSSLQTQHRLLLFVNFTRPHISLYTTAINFCRWRAKRQINATGSLTCDETLCYDPPPSPNDFLNKPKQRYLYKTPRPMQAFSSHAP